jgi:proline dehydrogenase
MSFRAVVLHITQHPLIRRVIADSQAARRLSKRWVPGEALEDALAAVKDLNAAGITASLDHLGENVASEAEARAAAQVYLQMLDEIHRRGLESHVSVKLTQMGLDISSDLCRENLTAIVQRASEQGNFVRVDMESSEYTDRTLAMVREMHQRFENVGTVIQACLHRSDNDSTALMEEQIRIRLCKGAYQEPPSVAYQHKVDVDRNYVRLSQELLTSGIYHGIATHDPRMIQAAVDHARRHQVPSSAFEFQMLYGIRRDLQRKLRADGWNVRVYIPFGSHWFPYLTRRLAERPANLLFLLRNVFRG